jgi:hypothetical protein
MTKPEVVRITTAEALPFLRAFNETFQTTVADEFEAMFATWIGLKLKGVVRAVLGLKAISETEVFVWGIAGDGSGTVDEALAGVYLLKVLDGLDYHLTGAVLPRNAHCKHQMAKRGWENTGKSILGGADKEFMEIWERSFPGEVL